MYEYVCALGLLASMLPSCVVSTMLSPENTLEMPGCRPWGCTTLAAGGETPSCGTGVLEEVLT